MKLIPHFRHEVPRFPRPCRFVARRFVLPCQIGISEPLAKDLRHAEFKPLAVVHVLAVIKAEHLLIEIAEKMERLNRHIRAMQLPLYQTPEVFNRIRVHLAAHVFNGMVNYFMLKVLVESDIRPESVSVKRRANFDVLTNQWLHGRLAPFVYDLGANLPAALNEADNGSLVLFDSSGKHGLSVLVHVPRLTADEGFVYFDTVSRAAEFRGVERVLQSKSQTLKHKPCRLLRNSQCSVNLHAGDSVLAVAEHPKSRHPLVESKRRVLKYRSNLERKLLVASPAEPQFPRLDEIVLSRATARTRHVAIGKAQLLRVLESAVRIGKVNDGLLESAWWLHKTMLLFLFACVKYIFALNCTYSFVHKNVKYRNTVENSASHSKHAPSTTLHRKVDATGTLRPGVSPAGFPRLAKAARTGASPFFFFYSEPDADAGGDEVAAPVVDEGGVADVGIEFEVAGLVGAFDEPSSEVVAEDAADGVSVVELGLLEGFDARRRIFPMGGELDAAFAADEEVVGRAEFVFDEAGHLEHFHAVAIEDGIEGGVGDFRRQDDAMELEVHAHGQVFAEMKLGADVEGLLLGVIVGVLREADFAASHDVGAAVEVGTFVDNDFAIDCAYGAGLPREVSEAVEGLANVDGEVGTGIVWCWSLGRESRRECGDDR